jgi:hypothetical protein
VSVAGFCVHANSNEPSISIKGAEFFDQLSNYQLLKEASSPLRYSSTQLTSRE